tara:strand:+ start:24 stop:1262 length:1239 start_codon:yes stop_codon:yes gene_type:complete
MNKKISALTALGTTPAVGDIIPITDVSDTTGSAQGTTKKVTVANLVAAAPQGDLLASNNLSDVANAGTSRTNLGLGTAATTASTDYASAFYNIVTKTGNYTLTNAENGKVIFCNSSSRIDITVPSGLTSGFNCRVVQGGAGRVLFVTSGTTINGYTSGSDAPNAVIGQHGVADLVPTGTNIYSLHGDINYLSLFNNTKSVDFDATNDEMTFDGTSMTGLSSFSISMWLYQRSTTDGIIFGNFGSGISQGWMFYGYGTTSIKFYSSNGSYVSFGTIPQTLNSWQHIVGVNDNGSGSLYLNGSLNATSTGLATNFSSTYNNGELGQIVNGLIDEVSTFNTALSSADVTAMYNSGVPNDLTQAASYNTDRTANLVNYWRMGDDDGGTGTTITDQGSGSDDGTLVNGPTFSSTVPS